MELDSCLKVSFTHLVLSSVSICYSWTQMSVFSSLNWWIGCCIVLWVCTNPSSFQCPQFEVVWWCGDITSDPLLSATKGYTMQHFLFFPPILDSTEARGLSPLWLLGILSQTRQIKVCTIFICFSGGFTSMLWCTCTCHECSKCLYCRDTKCELCFIYFWYNEPKFLLVKIMVRVQC